MTSQESTSSQHALGRGVVWTSGTVKGTCHKAKDPCDPGTHIGEENDSLGLSSDLLVHTMTHVPAHTNKYKNYM